MASSTEDMRGYDHQFVEKYPDGLICLICQNVARDPQQISCCGKLLCRACLEEHKKGSNNCPQCREHIINFADKRSKHIIIYFARLKERHILYSIGLIGRLVTIIWCNQQLVIIVVIPAKYFF